MLEEQQNSSEIQPAASETSVPTTRKASNRYVSRSVREFVKWAPSGAAGIPFLSFLLQQHWAQALLVSKQPEGILQVDLEDVFMPLRMQLSMGEGARKGKRAGETGKIVYKYGMCWNDRKSLTATRMLRSWRVGDQGRRRCFGI